MGAWVHPCRMGILLWFSPPAWRRSRQVPKLLEAVEAVGPEPNYDMHQFVEWFLQQVKTA